MDKVRYKGEEARPERVLPFARRSLWARIFNTLVLGQQTMLMLIKASRAVNIVCIFVCCVLVFKSI